MMKPPTWPPQPLDLGLPLHPKLPITPPRTDDDRSSECEHEADVPLPPPTSIPSTVLDVDENTPDHHVPRDPSLIRLTGVHPFNSEPPLSALFDEGFLTSPDRFYVRNHGPVPAVRDEDIPHWEFSIEGLVEKPCTMTLKDLIANYEQITCPISLVCAGNRRKEQNQVRKSKGFSWGAAGVSTALFTGVALSELIRRARPMRKAKYLCMEGADTLPNGKYGTSVKLNWALDPNRGMMLAHKMNGEGLRPDHGKPLRAVIPGQIGGRSVKWIKRLVVTATPSDNWYHIYDNRVLPTMVSPEASANDPSMWADERYAIYDLSVNSATVYPAHNERLDMNEPDAFYAVKGYAYSGGGRRVTRVELSLDQGRTWKLADIDYPEDRYREATHYLFGGRIDMSWRESCFCWCQWKLDIPITAIAGAKDLVVRAMDEAMNVQPRDMYWNVLGMMNNPWFRVAIRNEGDSLIFEHPTQPAQQPGGWMGTVKKAGGDLKNGHWGEEVGNERSPETVKQPVQEVVMTKAGITREISANELKEHENDQSPWFVINDEVYDGSAFLKGHPGGAQSIISAAGQDSTEDFLAIHSETAKAMMPTYHIGRLATSIKTAKADRSTKTADTTPASSFLNPREWFSAPLASRRLISSDTLILTFQLQSDAQILGLPVGQHIMIRLKDHVTQKSIIRSYTPISVGSQQGTVDVLIKLYLDTATRPGGLMSKALNVLPIGSTVDIKGPTGEFEYIGRGLCKLHGQEKRVKRFAMICAGSGITPVFQVFQSVLGDAEDRTTCILLNGNRTEEDILCRAEVDGLLEAQDDKARVIHTLTKPPWGWDGRRGRICKQLVAEVFGDPDPDTLVLVCGPGPMEKVVRSGLKELGWIDEQVHFF